MWVRGGQGGAGKAWLCVRVRHWGLVILDARGRGWEGESADVHAGEAAGGLSSLRGGWGVSGHAFMMNQRALSVGAWGPGRGWEGMVVCTSEALGP